MREMTLKNMINDDEEDRDQSEDLIDEIDKSPTVLTEGKVNNFKLRLIKQFNYFEEHYNINAFGKLILGLIFLFFPFICIIVFNNINFSSKNDFIFFPYFLSICIMIGALMILLVIKIGEACQMYGIIIYAWERKIIFKIINSIIIGFYFLWFFFICEKFTKSYNLLKEKVAQTSIKESSTKLFNRGSYTLRILFILFFWDTEKDINNNYIHKLLEYFEYEESLFHDFNSYIQSLLIPILFLTFYNIFKTIFFKDRKNILFSLLNMFITIQSFYIIFYPININDKEHNVFNEKYFSNTNCKYFELIIYLIIILILILGSFKLYILKLIRKKYFPKRPKKKKIIIISIIFVSFLINLIGYILVIILLFMFAFGQINEELKVEKYQFYWLMIYLSISFILIGYSFIFGHYCFNFIYYPISYETTPHSLKNEFYTKCSGKLVKSTYASYNAARFSKKSFDVLIP